MDNELQLPSLVDKGDGTLIDPTISVQEDIQDDIDETIGSMKSLSSSLVSAVEELITVAKASQNDKYYNALANLAKAANESHRDTVNALKTKSEHVRVNRPEGATPAQYSQTINNNLVMTTTEMVEFLRKKHATESP